MATSKNTAAESIRRLALQYQEMVAAADLLESIGSAESAAEGAKAARVAAEADRDAAIADRDAAREALVKTKEDAKAMVDAAREQAHGIVADAKVAAEGLVADAKSRAEALLIAGQAQASEALAGVAGQLAIKQALVAELQTAIEELEAKKLDVQSAADAAQAKLDAVTAQIRKLVDA